MANTATDIMISRKLSLQNSNDNSYKQTNMLISILDKQISGSVQWSLGSQGPFHHNERGLECFFSILLIGEQEQLLPQEQHEYRTCFGQCNGNPQSWRVHIYCAVSLVNRTQYFSPHLPDLLVLGLHHQFYSMSTFGVTGLSLWLQVIKSGRRGLSSDNVLKATTSTPKSACISTVCYRNLELIEWLLCLMQLSLSVATLLRWRSRQCSYV